jgi:hypothetical protein
LSKPELVKASHALVEEFKTALQDIPEFRQALKKRVLPGVVSADPTETYFSEDLNRVREVIDDTGRSIDFVKDGADYAVIHNARLSEDDSSTYMLVMGRDIEDPHKMDLVILNASSYIEKQDEVKAGSVFYRRETPDYDSGPGAGGRFPLIRMSSTTDNPYAVKKARELLGGLTSDK